MKYDSFKSLTAAEAKFIKSLHQKKGRQEEGRFLVEGDKTVRELLASGVAIHGVYALDSWLRENSRLIGKGVHTYAVTPSQLKSISTHEQPNGVIAVAHIPKSNVALKINNELCLAGDGINDPGNLGSIIRIADWFGVKKIVLSTDSVDAYNPKTVSAAKGSLFRVSIQYTDLAEFLKHNKTENIYGAFMDGENIYNADLSGTGIIVIGNEANGIGSDIEKLVSNRIAIPSFGVTESLNAAIATGIIVSEFKRRSL